METTWLPLDGCPWNLTFEYFSKICQENKSFIEIRQEQRIFQMKTSIHLWFHLSQLLLEWEMFQTKVVEKIKTRVLCSITFPRKSCRLWENVEKYCTAGQATYYNIIRRRRFSCRTTEGRIQTHTQNMYYLLLLHGNNGHASATQCYVTRTLFALFNKDM